jgi:DNA-binding MarR family transcriptional regulator
MREQEIKILRSLAVGPKTWADLKDETDLADGTLAKYLRLLLEKGLITEEIDKKDRRKKIYRLNEKMLAQYLPKDVRKEFLSLILFVEVYSKIVDYLSRGEIEELERYIGKMFITLGVHEDATDVLLKALYMVRFLVEDLFAKYVDEKFAENVISSLEFSSLKELVQRAYWVIYQIVEMVYIYEWSLSNKEKAKKIIVQYENDPDRMFNMFKSQLKSKRALIEFLKSDPLYSKMIEKAHKQLESNVFGREEELLKEIMEKALAEGEKK